MASFRTSSDRLPDRRITHGTPCSASMRLHMQCQMTDSADGALAKSIRSESCQLYAGFGTNFTTPACIGLSRPTAYPCIREGEGSWAKLTLDQRCFAETLTYQPTMTALQTKRQFYYRLKQPEAGYAALRDSIVAKFRYVTTSKELCLHPTFLDKPLMNEERKLIGTCTEEIVTCLLFVQFLLDKTVAVYRSQKYLVQVQLSVLGRYCTQLNDHNN